MKTKSLFTLCFIILHSSFSLSAHAQGTAFTYQGRLATNGVAVTGANDFKFTLFDLVSGGAIVAGPITNFNVGVSNGLFTTALDFGAVGDAFYASDRWLEIATRPAGSGAFTNLSPRQPITPVPHSFYANNAGFASAALNLTGPVPSSSLVGGYPQTVFITNAANQFRGAFTGNGTGLTSVNAATLGGLNASNLWKLGGNAGANPTNGAFLGTTDNLPLEFKVNGKRALRLEPTSNYYYIGVNVVGGYSSNVVDAGVVGATISGGGWEVSSGSGNSINRVSGDFGTVGGGYGNTSQREGGTVGGGMYNTSGSVSATVAGGIGNESTGDAATVGGGHDNSAGGFYSTVPGGFGNVAQGNYSLAAGAFAGALHLGTFVWADFSSYDGFASTAPNQFLIRAAGGVGIGTTKPLALLNVNGNARVDADNSVGYGEGLSLNFPTNMPAGGYGGIHFHNAGRGSNYDGGTIKWSIFYNSTPDPGAYGKGLAFVQNNANTRLYLGTNGNVGIGTVSPSEKLHVVGNILATGTITPNSDRNAKTNFAPVDAASVLERVAALPISQWRFKTETDEVKHIGPMAQDFRAAFGLGAVPTAIATVDADGVALAAIQGLNQKVEERDGQLEARSRKLEAENADLKARLEKLEQLLSAKNGGGR